jgi:L-ascorbate metabolism protein UlaG (beta-lactamase superfamily)
MLRITSLGHASFRFEVPSGAVYYLDAWLGTNPFCPSAFKTVERADVFLVTHGHEDHLDENLTSIATESGAKIVAPPAVRQYLESKGAKDVEEINKGGTVAINDVRITMTDAIHGSHIGSTYPHEACGYLLRATNMPTIYVAGDTAIFPGMELLGRMYRPEVAILPIGGRYTMGPYEAAWAVKLIGCNTVVPSHYGTFPFLPGTLEEFRDHLGDAEVRVLPIGAGETVEL